MPARKNRHAEEKTGGQKQLGLLGVHEPQYSDNEEGDDSTRRAKGRRSSQNPEEGDTQLVVASDQNALIPPRNTRLSYGAAETTASAESKCEMKISGAAYKAVTTKASHTQFGNEITDFITIALRDKQLRDLLNPKSTTNCVAINTTQQSDDDTTLSTILVNAAESALRDLKKLQDLREKIADYDEKKLKKDKKTLALLESLVFEPVRAELTRNHKYSKVNNNQEDTQSILRLITKHDKEIEAHDPTYIKDLLATQISISWQRHIALQAQIQTPEGYKKSSFVETCGEIRRYLKEQVNKITTEDNTDVSRYLLTPSSSPLVVEDILAHTAGYMFLRGLAVAGNIFAITKVVEWLSPNDPTAAATLGVARTMLMALQQFCMGVAAPGTSLGTSKTFREIEAGIKNPDELGKILQRSLIGGLTATLLPALILPFATLLYMAGLEASPFSNPAGFRAALADGVWPTFIGDRYAGIAVAVGLCIEMLSQVFVRFDLGLKRGWSSVLMNTIDTVVGCAATIAFMHPMSLDMGLQGAACGYLAGKIAGLLFCVRFSKQEYYKQFELYKWAGLDTEKLCKFIKFGFPIGVSTAVNYASTVILLIILNMAPSQNATNAAFNWVPFYEALMGFLVGGYATGAGIGIAAALLNVLGSLYLTAEAIRYSRVSIIMSVATAALFAVVFSAAGSSIIDLIFNQNSENPQTRQNYSHSLKMLLWMIVRMLFDSPREVMEDNSQPVGKAGVSAKIVTACYLGVGTILPFLLVSLRDDVESYDLFASSIIGVQLATAILGYITRKSEKELSSRDAAENVITAFVETRAVEAVLMEGQTDKNNTEEKQGNKKSAQADTSFIGQLLTNMTAGLYTSLNALNEKRESEVSKSWYVWGAGMFNAAGKRAQDYAKRALSGGSRSSHSAETPLNPNNP